MEVFTDASSMREYSRTQRRLGHKIALVPTMVCRARFTNVIP